MKRKFLKFPAQPVRYAPRMISRRMRIGIENRNIAYKSDGDPKEEKEEPEPKTEAEAIAAIGKQVDTFKNLLGEKANEKEVNDLKAKIEALEKNIATMNAKDISDQITAINKGNESLLKQIAELQEDKAKAEEKGGKSTKKHSLFSVEAVKNFITATFKDGKKTHDNASIEINTVKAAENFAYATFFEGGPETDITAFTGRFIDPELYQRRRKTNLILDYFTIRTINVPTLLFLIKVEDGDDAGSSSGDSGSAEWIVSGEAKPKRSFKVTTGKVEAKKVAIFGTVEDELLQDVSSLENWIREDFMDEMREEINDGLLNNNPTVNPDAPQGLKYAATQFTVTPAFSNTFTAATSTIIDQIVAAAATMRYRREEPDTVFISSDNWYRIHVLKDVNQRYQNSNLVYTNSLGQLFIAGVRVVAVDQEDVPSTHLLLIGRDLGFKIYAYGNLVFERGLNGEDFRYDRTSFRGYQRFLSYIPEHRENSVLYDTLANIQAAIEA